ncbi:M13 family metallopeptidase [Hymenobacter chitinivorans]|uniref:Putative endopeptidase n=1 Tax=Hymenobacter chitinivorans DSM 11115 TaxID=1121954 RepID=A0A2M9B908_9BACT|nr:M13 family metallopeptidase [Hymenobacter chitinivorans]PJJ54407.1 putative endopeptidase [Hymenobacter chitinivorans DSM 11115]
MKKSFTLFALLILPCALSIQAQQASLAPAQHSNLDQTTIDRTIKPGDGFYNYANGSWLKVNEIPANEASWGSSSMLQKQTRFQLQELLKATAAQKNQPGSDAQKLQNLYTSGMNTAVLDQLGVQPLQADLQRIDAISSPQGIAAEVTTQYATGLVRGTAPLFNLGHIADPIRNDVEIITLSQGGMGLPEKSYYSEASPKAVATREKYVAYLQQLFELSGTAKEAAQTKAAAVLALETRLALGARTATENRNIRKLLNYYTLDKVGKQFPLLGFGAMFQQLNIPSAKIIVAQPEFFTGLHKELTATPLATWKDYLKVRLLSNSSQYLSMPFLEANFAFYVTALTGRTQMRTRPEQMVLVADGMLGEMLGKVYVEKYFTADSKKRMDALVQNVVTTFAERIQANTWMTAPTKEKALQKLSTVKRKIAYPDQWRDYSALQIGPDYFSNIKAATVFSFHEGFNRVGKPVDRDLWTMTPPTLNAYYSPLNNEIVFPAGILLPPFFDPQADDAVNYGGIATVIGHEISHGFDDQGSHFNAQGRYKNWWTSADKKNFTARGVALTRQFNQYVALDTLHVNGKLTLGENIGDLCGVTVAYQAFKKTEQGKSTQLIDGLTPDQRFFLSYATIWRKKDRDEGLRTQVLTDSHSPARFRVDGPLSNLEAFYTAFNIKEGDALWRPVSDRVVIW